MVPPIIVTEDTPPDMLAGSMDLTVVLPDRHSLKMSVERSTPMMDLLVQVTTANKLSPAGYIIKPLNERGSLPYKPSTPIGALDAWTIHVVPKHLAQCTGVKRHVKTVNQPFEQTFRLQVHLPRNQLFVARVSPKTRLADILFQVCSEKNLDPVKYSLRHPGNLDQVLSLSCSLADYKLQELTLVCNRTHPVEVSTVDIMSLQRDTSNPAYRNTMCEGSVSSGSLEGRSLSPVPSDESSASPPPLPPNRPTRKRRPAPKPPIANQKTVIEEKQVNGIQTSKVINHSRNSSDSSGYHEASVLSESPQSVPDPLSQNKTVRVTEGSLSQSMTDVSVIQPPLQQASSYNSMTSLSSITGRKKKAAPPPPSVGKVRASSLIEDKQRTSSVSSTASSTTTLDGNDMNVTMKSATLPPSSRLNNVPPPSNPPPITKVEIEPPVTLQVAPAPRPRSKPINGTDVKCCYGQSETVLSNTKKPTAPQPKPRKLAPLCSPSVVNDPDDNECEEKLNLSFENQNTNEKPLKDKNNSIRLKKVCNDNTVDTRCMVNISRPMEADIQHQIENNHETKKTNQLKSKFSEEESWQSSRKPAVEMVVGPNSGSDTVMSDVIMADEEIDRIFTNAIENHSDFECRRDDQGTTLPSPPNSLTQNEFLETSHVDDSVDWEYRLPAPPTFRDDTKSPTVTEFGTMTLGNLSDILRPNTEAQVAETNQKPVDATELNPKPVNVAEQNQKPVDVAETNPKPVDVAEQNQKPVDLAETNQKPVDVAETNQKLVVVAETNVKTVDVYENQNESLENLKSIKLNNISNNHERNIKLMNGNRVNPDTCIGDKQCKLQNEKSTKECVKQHLVDDLTHSLNQSKPVKNENYEENRQSSKTLPSNITLDNFCITTYKDTKPVEVFEDDSIKSSVGEKRDKSKDDAVFRAPKPRVKEPNLSRTSSFSMENKLNGPLIKRSVSYVSLLAANMPRHSQPYRAHLTEQHSDALWPKLRKTTSELNIDTKDNVPEPSPWQATENPSELQSVQVLRNILSQSQANLSQPDGLSHSQQRHSPTSNLRSENSIEQGDGMKWGRSHSEEGDCSATKWTSKSKFEHSTSFEDEYSNSSNINKGPPSINLSTWSERPKQQISIKDDGDYRFGFGKKCTWQDDVMTRYQLNNNNSELSKRNGNYKDQVLLNKTEGFKMEGKSKSISDLSRIPVVTAVELKKPYTVCNFDGNSSKFNQNLKVNNKTLPNQETVISNDCQNDSDGFIGVNSLARKFGVPNKRPLSTYDTGTWRIDDKCEKVNRANTIERNTFSTSKILEGENELQEKVRSFRNKCDSTSVIKAFSKIRCGGIVEDLPDCPNVNLPKNCVTSQLLKKENKWNDTNSTNDENQALFDNPKLVNNNCSKVVINSGSSRQTQTLDRNLRPVNLHPVVKGFSRVSITPSSNCYKNFAATSPNVEDSKLSSNISSTSLNQDCQVYKTSYKPSLGTLNLSSVSLTHIKDPAKEKNANTVSSLSSGQESYSNKSKVKTFNTVPIPPPPPSLPVLKPVGERKGVKLLPPPAADPRDLLMSSIRSFRRDDLKTISK